MNLQDGARNQHFIPRVEQRLNALNPLATDKNKKIYAFTLNDRESYSIKLTSNNGVKINNSLSLIDLFSLEVLGKGAERYNFEKLFHRYESSIKYNTESIINKLSISGADIKPEILNIFASKFFNFIRNPYSVKKVLNSFPSITNFRPTDPVHLSNFEKVIKGKKLSKNIYAMSWKYLRRNMLHGCQLYFCWPPLWLKVTKIFLIRLLKIYTKIQKPLFRYIFTPTTIKHAYYQIEAIAFPYQRMNIWRGISTYAQIHLSGISLVVLIN